MLFLAISAIYSENLPLGSWPNRILQVVNEFKIVVKIYVKSLKIDLSSRSLYTSEWMSSGPCPGIFEGGGGRILDCWGIFETS